MRYVRELDFPIEQGLEFRMIPKMIASLRCFRLILRYQALAGFICFSSCFLYFRFSFPNLAYKVQRTYLSNSGNTQ